MSPPRSVTLSLSLLERAPTASSLEVGTLLVEEIALDMLEACVVIDALMAESVGVAKLEVEGLSSASGYSNEDKLKLAAKYSLIRFVCRTSNSDQALSVSVN